MTSSVQGLLRASRSWASRQPTVTVLVSANDGGAPLEDCLPEDTQLLFDAWRQLGLRIVLSAWQEASPPIAVALPLGTWDYYEVHDQFVSKMRELCTAGTAPGADLEAVAWCSHKSYLLELAAAGLPVVPTRLIRRGESECALSLTTAIEQLGRPRYCVVKPVIGGRGDGVERLRTCDGCPEWLSTLLHTHSVLVQPFLPEVTRRGEICLVFVNGALLHVVHKDPRKWGAPAGHAADAGTGAKPIVSGAGLLAHECTRQSVLLLDPPPLELVALAQRVLEFAADRCGGMPYLARVDLLPSGPTSNTSAPYAGSSGSLSGCTWTAGWEWLVSELELGWPELFLRASPGAVQRVAKALLNHIPESGTPHVTGFENSEQLDHRAVKRPRANDD